MVVWGAVKNIFLENDYFFFGGGGKNIFRDISFEMKCLTEVNFNISND